MRPTNIFWNFAGLGAPLIIAALTIPSLITQIGMERFGLLALAWGLIGFAGIFDLGVGRATTQTVAKLRGSSQFEQIPGVVKTATRLSFRTGLIGALLLVVCASVGAHTHIKYVHVPNTEVTFAAYLLAIAVPVQSMSAMYRGINEAFENFGGINLIRIGLGIANFLAPFCLSLASTNVALLVSTLVISRLIAFILFRILALRCLRLNLQPDGASVVAHSPQEISRQLLSFGGWFTVSSLISPMLVQADRLFIGTLISASAIATYTIPYEPVTQTLIISGAVTSVAFPNLASLVFSQPDKAAAVFRIWFIRVSLLMLLVTASCAALLPSVLPLWIGKALSPESVSIGQILCIGVYANSLASMFFSFLHAHGRADITAKAHIVELPLFLSALYLLLAHFGVVGAAIAWTGRMSLDLLILWLAKRKCLRTNAITRTPVLTKEAEGTP